MVNRKQLGCFPLFRHTICGTCLALALIATASAQSADRRTTLSILDLGKTAFATAATNKLRDSFKAIDEVSVLDSELSRSAARGSGYAGSLNMSLNDARDLGAALSSDFYLTGDAQTLRRTSSTTPVFYEAYCSLFVISSRSGKLAVWDRLSVESPTAEDAERRLLSQLDQSLGQRIYGVIKKVQSEERQQRAIVEASVPVIEEAPDDEKTATAQGLRLPRPFRRLRPDYPPSAAKADAEATVDVLVDVGANGEVDNVEIVRWAGFGLDEATVATVRQLHFFPAMRNGTAIPLRVLLRYNFRKPALP